MFIKLIFYEKLPRDVARNCGLEPSALSSMLLAAVFGKLGLGGLILAKNFQSEKQNSACSGLFQLVIYNIEKAKNISPSTKALMGFISFEGYICVWGGWGEGGSSPCLVTSLKSQHAIAAITVASTTI